eukprot:5376412-Amphidinium_carterae.1
MFWHQQHGTKLDDVCAGAAVVHQWVKATGMQINAKTVVWSSSQKAKIQHIADALGVPHAEQRGHTKDLGGDFLVALPRQCMGPAQKHRILTGLQQMKRLRRARLLHWIVPPVYQGAHYPRLFWDCELHHVTAQPI